MRVALVLLSGAVGLGCGRLTVDDGQAKLSGRVIDGRGAPVSNARVMLVRDRRPVGATVSDAEGRFALIGPAGPEAAVLALVSPTSSEGAWRAGLDLLPSGTTHLGDLTTQALWAWPETLWLRDTGLEEQLTHAGADNYLGGGSRDVPLLTWRQTPTHFEVRRVDDDGTSRVLLSEAGSSLFFPSSPKEGRPLPNVLRAWFTRDDAGEARVGILNGGASWALASGTVTTPFTRLRWLTPSGHVVGDVALDPDASSVLFSGDAVVENRVDGATVYFASGQSIRLGGSFGVYVIGSAHLLLDCQPDRCRVSRVSPRGEVSTVSISMPTEQLRPIATAGVLRLLSRTSGQLVVTEVEPATLTTRTATAPLGSRGWAQVPDCETGVISGYLEQTDTGFRLTTFGPLAQRAFVFDSSKFKFLSRVYSEDVRSTCLGRGELWAVVTSASGERHLMRSEGDTLSSEPFPWTVVMHVGGRQLLRDTTPEQHLWLSSTEGASPTQLTRLPFVVPEQVGETSDVVLARASLSDQGTSLFRLKLPGVTP